VEVWLQSVAERTYGGTSGVCEGEGLFVRWGFKEGQLIGIYGGTAVSAAGDYVMAVRTDLWIDGNVATGLCTRFKLINDYIWDEDKQNCILTSGGVIWAMRDIKAGEELFMSYSEWYNWDRVKMQHLRRTLQHVQQAGQVLGGIRREEEEALEAMVRAGGEDDLPRWRIGGGVRRLLADFVDGMGGGAYLHRVSPQRRDDDNDMCWLARLLSCFNFHEQVGFRKGGPQATLDVGWLTQLVEQSSVARPRRGQRVNYCESSLGWLNRVQ
jgi:hypothetical protein